MKAFAWCLPLAGLMAAMGSWGQAQETAAPTYPKLRLTVHAWPLEGAGLAHTNSGVGIAEFRIRQAGAAVPLNGKATVEAWPAKTGAEGMEKLIDDSTGTKYYTSTPEDGKYVFVFTATGEPFALDGYQLVAADQNGRNPMTWTLEGFADGGEWKLLDIRTLGVDDVKGWGSGKVKDFDLPGDCLGFSATAEGEGPFTPEGLGAANGERNTATLTLPAGATLDLSGTTLFRLSLASEGDVTLVAVAEAAPAVAWLDLSGVKGTVTLTCAVGGTVIANAGLLPKEDGAQNTFILPNTSFVVAETPEAFKALKTLARQGEGGNLRLAGGETLEALDVSAAVPAGRTLEIAKPVRSVQYGAGEDGAGVLSLREGRTLRIVEGAELTVATRFRTCDTSNSDRVEQTGGTVLCSGSGEDAIAAAGNAYKYGAFVLGHWNNVTTAYGLSGGTLTVSESAAKLGGDGVGNLTVGGTGAAFLHSVVLRNGSTLAVAEGGTLNLGAEGVAHSAVVSASSGTLRLAGGTLGPWQAPKMTLGVPLTLADGTTSTLRTETADGTTAEIALTGALSGTGGLRVVGGGIVDLAGNRPAKLTPEDTVTVRLTLSDPERAAGKVTFRTDMADTADCADRFTALADGAELPGLTAAVADGVLTLTLPSAERTWATEGAADWAEGFAGFAAGDHAVFGPGGAEARLSVPVAAGTVAVQGDATLAFLGGALTAKAVEVAAGATLTLSRPTYPWLRLKVKGCQADASLPNRDGVALGEWRFLRDGKEAVEGAWYANVTGPANSEHPLANMLDHKLNGDKWYTSASTSPTVTIEAKPEAAPTFDAYAFYGTDRWGRLPSAWTLEASGTGKDGDWTLIDEGTLAVASDPHTCTLAGTFALDAPLGVTALEGVTVAGTLAGTGTLRGDVTFEAGSALALSDEGVLTIEGTVTGTVAVALPDDADVTPLLRNAGNVAFSLPEGFRAVKVGNLWHALRETAGELTAEVSASADWAALHWVRTDGQVAADAERLFSLGVVEAATLSATAAEEATLSLSGTVSVGCLKISGGAVRLSGGTLAVGTAEIAAGAALAVPADGLKAATGAGTLTLSAAGTADLRGALALTGFSGPLGVDSGTVRLNLDGAGLNGAAGAAALDIAQGATLRLSVTGANGDKKVALPATLLGEGRLELANDASSRKDAENGFTQAIDASGFRGTLAIVGGDAIGKAFRISLGKDSQTTVKWPQEPNAMTVEILGDHTQVFGLGAAFTPTLSLSCTNTAPNSAWPDGGDTNTFGCFRPSTDTVLLGDIRIAKGTKPRIGGGGTHRFKGTVSGEGELLLGTNYGTATCVLFFEQAVSCGLRLRNSGSAAEGCDMDVVLRGAFSGNLAFEASGSGQAAVTFGADAAAGRAGQSLTVLGGATATLAEGMAWEAPGGLSAQGTLALAGGTLAGDVALADGATLDLSAGAATLAGAVAAEGTLRVATPEGLAAEEATLLTAQRLALAAAPIPTRPLPEGGLFATETALAYRPIALTAEGGSLPDDPAVRGALTAAAAKAGLSEATVRACHADGATPYGDPGKALAAAALFEGVVIATPATESAAGTVGVAYDFGIGRLLLRGGTEAEAGGRFALIAAKVRGPGAVEAAYAPDTAVEVLVDGVAVAAEAVPTPEGEAAEAGVRWLRFPCASDLGTVRITVRATNEANE